MTHNRSVGGNIPLVVGVDGGGSKTLAVAMAADGGLVGEGAGGPANINTVGVEAAVANIVAAVRAATGGRRALAVHFGLAGADREEDVAALRPPLAAAGLGDTLSFSHDAAVALAAGTVGGPGAVVIAGTGSIAYGQDPDGRSARAGGWGYLVGDEGSGWTMAREAMAAALRDLDGRGPATALTRAVLGFLGVDGPGGIVARLHGRGATPVPRHELVPLAGAVLTAASDGDGVAAAILARAASDLADLLHAVLRRLGAEPWPTFAAGGLFEGGGEVLLGAVRRELAARRRPAMSGGGGSGPELALLPRPPVAGAVTLALAAAGLDPQRVGDVPLAVWPRGRSAALAVRAAGAAGVSRQAGALDAIDPRAPAASPASGTEARHPGTTAIDTWPTLAVVTAMNREDRLVPLAIEPYLPDIAAVAEAAGRAIGAGGRLIYVGAGTSGRLAVLDASECPPTFGAGEGTVVGIIAGGEAAWRQAAEGAEDDAGAGRSAMAELDVGPRDVVVGIAASGRTPFTLAAVQEARARGALTAAVTANPGSPLALAANIGIAPATGAEIIAGSTRLKAGTAQKLVLNMISTAAFVAAGRVYSNLMVGMRPTNSKLAARARRILVQVSGCTEAEAEAGLAEAGGDLAVAAVARLAGVGPDEARRRLAASRGHIRSAVEGKDRGGH